MVSLVFVLAVVAAVTCRPQSSQSLFRGSSQALISPLHSTQIPFHHDTQYQTVNAQQTAYTENQQTTQYSQQQQQQQQQQPGFKNYPVQQSKEIIPILAYSNDVAYDGSYQYNYETADGISRQETGVMTNPGTDDEAQSVSGSYSYTAPDGTLITVTYTADTNGFRAEGAHLPTPPPVPDAIARALEYIARTRAANPSASYEDDGQYQRNQQDTSRQYQSYRQDARARYTA